VRASSSHLPAIGRPVVGRRRPDVLGRGSQERGERRHRPSCARSRARNSPL
jgi:hypothetical protein